eukprot:scaffold68712_cov21-Tisochrysis_lutea.AAC.2
MHVCTYACVQVGTAATYATYGREVSISYVVGALAGIVYLRLLGKSVDGVGGGQIGGGGAGSVVGQPRLLIPLILALAYNRVNECVGVGVDAWVACTLEVIGKDALSGFGNSLLISGH